MMNINDIQNEYNNNTTWDIMTNRNGDVIVYNDYDGCTKYTLKRTNANSIVVIDMWGDIVGGTLIDCDINKVYERAMRIAVNHFNNNIEE